MISSKQNWRKQIFSFKKGTEFYHQPKFDLRDETRNVFIGTERRYKKLLRSDGESIGMDQVLQQELGLIWKSGLTKFSHSNCLHCQLYDGQPKTFDDETE